jgi:hypothetical protein
MLLSIFKSPHQKKKEEKKSKNQKHCRKKTKKYVTVRRGHKGAQKITKDWLRKFKNTTIKI